MNQSDYQVETLGRWLFRCLIALTVTVFLGLDYLKKNQANRITETVPDVIEIQRRFTVMETGYKAALTNRQLESEIHGLKEDQE